MNMIETKIINTGTWLQVSIVKISFGFSQILKSGQWVNKTVEPERFEDEILTFGKCFTSETECEKFMSTKPFKSVLKGIEKNWKL